jgi:hypothetical protein
MTREGKKLTLLLILNTLLAMVVYFGCVALEFIYMMYVYVGLSAVLFVIYMIYNRGFVLRGATPDMLPDTMSPVEKQAKFDEAARRQRTSRWMLTVIIPMVVCILIDMIWLFLLENLLLTLGIEL